MLKKKKAPIDLLPQKDPLTALLRTHLERHDRNFVGYLSKFTQLTPELWLPTIRGPLFQKVQAVPLELYTPLDRQGRRFIKDPMWGDSIFGETCSLGEKDLRKVWEFCRFLEDIGLDRGAFGHLLIYNFQWRWLTFLTWLSGKSKPDYFWDGFDENILKTRKALFLSVQLFHELCKAGFCAVTTPPPMRCPSGSKLSFDAPLLLGVLNVTPDSFSDGGRFLDPHAAVRRAREMVREGAHALDLGAESTRPGAKPVSAKEQKRRLLPVIREIRREKALRKIPLSIDTQSAEVLRACLGEGADILNDISALRADRAMAKTAARAKCPVILMHMQGTPRTMQKDPKYVDVVDEIDLFFRKRIHAAYDAGIAPTNVVLDPGIGFGKTLEHNVEILRRLRELKALGRPLLIGVSRKSMLGKLSGEPVAEQRLPESLAAGSIALAHGAAILRVHDVAEHARAIKVAAPLVDAPVRRIRASTRRQKGR